jgi:hypothetical protein
MNTANLTPNYELLKEAYAIIDGIPDEYFDLESIVKNDTEHVGCGTIACAAGWLGLHPKFIKLGYTVTTNYGVTVARFKNAAYCGLYDALSRLFNVQYSDATSLFCASYDSRFDSKVKSSISHKEMWKNRVVAYLKEKGQL